jgi:hypothetical protein
MRCSPKFKQTERQDVGQRRCNRNCFHWINCLKELGLPEDFSVEDKETLWTKTEKPHSKHSCGELKNMIY